MSTKSTKKKVIKKTKDEIVFDNAMSSVKKIGIASGIALVILVLIGFVLNGKISYAALIQGELPETFTSAIEGSAAAECQANVPNDDGAVANRPCVQIYSVGNVVVPLGFTAQYSVTDGEGFRAEEARTYCIERNKRMASGVVYTRSASTSTTYPGLTYLLENANFEDLILDADLMLLGSSGSLTQFYTRTQYNQYLTQLAIWMYMDIMDPTLANLTAEESAAILASKFGTRISGYVDTATKYTADDSSLDGQITRTALQMTSDSFIATYRSAVNSAFTVKTNNANAKVLDASGAEKTTFASGEPFKISIPITELKDNKIDLSINIDYTKTVRSSYIYEPDDTNAQRTVLGNIETRNQSLSDTLTINARKVVIRKVDAETDERVAGATIVIRDIQGNTVAEFVTSADSDYTLYLPDGTYTATETVIPEGYSAEQVSTEFVINNEKDEYEFKFVNTKEIEVPDTEANSAIIYGVGIAIVIVGIILIVVAVKPKREKTKRK